ncbi:ABC transporter permease [soil metagenome]
MSIRTSTPLPHAELFPPARAPRAPSRWGMTLAEDARQLGRFWPVVQNMVIQELRVRYQRSILGFFWTLLNPIMMMATMAVVFSQVLGVGDPYDYAIYLFSGLVPWGLMASMLPECSICIVANEVLIRKIYLPKLIFPLTRVLVNLIMLVLSMSALFVLMIPLGARFAPSMVLLPVAVGLFAMFVLGIGLVIAIINTFYRDFGHLVAVVLQAWYFATPVLYKITQLPAEIRWRFWLNPAYPFIRLFQVIIHEGAWPDGVLFLIAASIAAVSLGVGYVTFKTYEDKLVFRL